MPKLSDVIFGKKGKSKSLSTLDPMQQQLLSLISQGISSGQGPLKDLFGGFDQESFERGVSQPALRHFQEQILPIIQEKFIAGNQVLGSGLQRAQLNAGVDLQDRLAQLLYQAQQDQQKNKLAGVQTALGTRAVENIYRPGTTGALQALAQGAGQGIGSMLGGAVQSAGHGIGSMLRGAIAG